MAEKVYIDHGDRVLAAAEDIMGGVTLRLFTPQGFSDFALQVEEMASLIALLQSAVAADAQKRLEDKQKMATPSAFPGFGPSFTTDGSGGSGA